MEVHYALSNEPKMNIVRCPYSPSKGAQERKTAVFRPKLYFSGRKSATKFLCVETVSNKVVRDSFAYVSVQKRLVGDVPSYAKIWPKLRPTYPSPKHQCSIDFRS